MNRNPRNLLIAGGGGMSVCGVLLARLGGSFFARELLPYTYMAGVLIALAGLAAVAAGIRRKETTAGSL